MSLAIVIDVVDGPLYGGNHRRAVRLPASLPNGASVLADGRNASLQPSLHHAETSVESFLSCGVLPSVRSARPAHAFCGQVCVHAAVPCIIVLNHMHSVMAAFIAVFRHRLWCFVILFHSLCILGDDKKGKVMRRVAACQVPECPPVAGRPVQRRAFHLPRRSGYVLRLPVFFLTYLT